MDATVLFVFEPLDSYDKINQSIREDRIELHNDIYACLFKLNT